MRICTRRGAIRLPVETRSCALGKPARSAQAARTALAFVLHFECRTYLGFIVLRMASSRSESPLGHKHYVKHTLPAQTSHFIFARLCERRVLCRERLNGSPT